MANTVSVDVSGPEGRKVLDALLKHAVTFTGAFRLRSKPEEERHFNYSGFLVSINEQWFMMTAGHILDELDPLLASGELEFTARVLADFYGDGVKHREPIPFVYESHERIHAYDKHLFDFALIPLGYLEVKQLAANGRVPFTFGGGPERPWAEYDGFAILGFPLEDVSSDAKEQREGPMTVVVRPGLSPVRWIDKLPPNVEPFDTSGWFLGELLDKSEPASVEGMSGGPIVGFKKNGENLDYWVIAIQSHWYPKSRITVGYPVQSVLGILEAAATGRP